MKRILTISATYGAGGSVIAPALARRLELPFLDRAVHADDVAIEARAQGEGLADDERDQSLVQRILHAFTTVPDDASAWVPPALPDRVATLRSEAEATVRRFLTPNGGVVLGWGAAYAVAGGFNVRLDGALDKRVLQAAGIEGIDEDAARRRLEETDRVRSKYVKRLYNRDVRDVTPYHLVLNTPLLGIGTSTTMIAEAAERFWADGADCAR